MDLLETTKGSAAPPLHGRAKKSDQIQTHVFIFTEGENMFMYLPSFNEKV